MTEHRLYRYTAIGRPLDPSVGTNRAVLLALPVLAVAGAAWSFLAGEPTMGSVLERAALFALGGFGCWALGRELLPDDHAAAFVSMVLGVLTCLITESPGLLILFATLGLVRIVNRSSGLFARGTDSALVTALVIWTVYDTESPWFAAVGALAFVLDAILKRPLKRQIVYALVCLGAMVVYVVDHDVPWFSLTAPNRLPGWICVFVLVLFSLNLLLLRKVHSRGDVGGNRLEPERVKGGMAVALLATLQGIDEAGEVAFLVATIGGLCLGIAFRRAFRTSGKGLRAS